MRVADLMAHATCALSSLGVHQFGQDDHPDSADGHASRQWLSNWTQRHNLRLRNVQPLETMPMDFATTTGLIKRLCEEVVEQLRPIPMQLRLNADEVIITFTSGPAEQVFY